MSEYIQPIGYGVMILAVIAFALITLPEARRRDAESLETLRRVYRRGPLKYDPATGCYYMTPEQQAMMAEDHERNLAVRARRKARRDRQLAPFLWILRLLRRNGTKPASQDAL